MGSFDGAEISDLLLHKIGEKFPDEDIGLYRDDGLGVTTHPPWKRACTHCNYHGG